MGKIIYLDEFKNNDEKDYILKGKEYGKINVTVYLDEETNLPFFYIEPDKAELIPIVDVIDEALSIHPCSKYL